MQQAFNRGGLDSEVGDARSHLGAEKFDTAQRFGVGKQGVGHLQGDTIDASELLGYAS